MIIKCPNCQICLRADQVTSTGRFSVRCPRCQTPFKVRSPKSALLVLIAHEDDVVCRQLTDRVSQLECRSLVCRHSEDIIELCQTKTCVLLLDVAFNGTFPFQLIDKFKNSGNDQNKIVLLPSVYNRTAYKKRPDSLYGADTYLELHHIGDRLVPLFAELYPDYPWPKKPVPPVVTMSNERRLTPDDVSGQAGSLAKLLVADILLYNQEQLEQGIASGQLEQMFTAQLDEGRRMLAARLPAAVDLPVDFIRQAFDAACQSYSCN